MMLKLIILFYVFPYFTTTIKTNQNETTIKPKPVSQQVSNALLYAKKTWPHECHVLLTPFYRSIIV